MSTTIGDVNINLRLSLAQFKQDTADGTNAASKAAQDMGNSMSGGADHARESMRLLSEEVGVHLPRGLQSAIAEIPGVGAALNSMFASVAVVAFIEVVVKVVEKIQELKAKAAEAAKAWEDLGDTGQANLRKIQEEALALQIQLDNLDNDTVKALSDEIKLIDEQTLDAIAKQFEELGKKAEDALAKMQVGGVASFFGMGNDKAVKVVQEDLDAVLNKVKQLRDAGDNDGIGKLLDQKIAEIKSFKDIAFENDPHPEVRQQALEGELQTLTTIKQTYEGINANAAAHKEIVNDTADAARLAEETAEYNKQLDTLHQLEAETTNIEGVKEDQFQREITRVESAIGKWKQYEVTVAGANGAVSAIANQAIESLNKELAVLQAQEAAAKGIPELTGKHGGGIKDNFATEFSKTFDAPKPVYGGTKEDLEFLDIQTKSNVAMQEAQKIFTSTRTASEQYGEQVRILDSLLQQGAISQDTYNREIDALKVKLGQGGISDGVKYFFDQFTQGSKLASDTFQLLDTGIKGFEDNLSQALATGTAKWADYFASLEEMILKSSLNTLLKTALGGLNDSSFLGNTLGGLFGKGGLFGGPRASGGPVEPGHFYRVNENGEELFSPGVSGTIIPHGNMPGGSSQQVIHQHFNITTPDADSFRKSQPQIQAEMYRSAAQSHGRFNR